MKNMTNKTHTTITIQKNTKRKLSLLGRKGQTFDKLLNEIVTHIEKCDRFWSENR